MNLYLGYIHCRVQYILFVSFLSWKISVQQIWTCGFYTSWTRRCNIMTIQTSGTNPSASQGGCQSASRQHPSCLLLLSCTALTSEMAAEPFLSINNLLLSVISLWNHQDHLDHPESYKTTKLCSSHADPQPEWMDDWGQEGLGEAGLPQMILNYPWEYSVAQAASAGV